jgi:superfamily II DNA or RNA helicase
MSVWDKIDEILDNYDPKERRNGKKLSKSSVSLMRPADKINICISRVGTYIDTSSLDPEIIRKIKNYYTIRDKTIMGYEKKTTCYRHQNDALFIPRFGSQLLKNKFSNVAITNQIKKGNPIKMDYTGEEPTFIQNLIMDELFGKWFNEENLAEGRAGAIINLQAGLGKTYLSLNLIGILQCRTLIVVHNRTILKQWKDLLEKKFPNNTVACYYGEKKAFGDIVVGVINSLVMPTIDGFDNVEDFYAKFDFVIFDESHEYCAPGRSKIFDVCQSPYMMGLSATPEDRPDNLDKIPRWNIGPILRADKLEGYSTESAPFKGNVIQVKYNGPKRFTKSIISKKLETICVPKMIEQFAADTQRTKLIADLTMEFHQKGYNIFVFADRREFLSDINRLLEEIHLNSHILTDEKEFDTLQSIRLVGGSKEEDMDLAKESKRIILTTYQYMSTGCSIPKMNCIILATPRRRGSRQTINRIFRLGSDYSIVRQIVDVVDWKTSLKNQWYERNEYYKSQGFTYEVRIINAEEV